MQKIKKMESPVSGTKLEELLDKLASKSTRDYINQCYEGDLLGFERTLRSDLDAIYNEICTQVLQKSAEELLGELHEKASDSGLSKLHLRPLEVQISTGHVVEVSNYYGRKTSESFITNFEGEQRHWLALYWGLIGKTSPAYYDKVGLCTAICPSYYISNQLLKKFGISGCISHNRDIMNKLGKYCKDKEEELVIRGSDTLTGKRVVISADGGRTRTRNYTGEMNEFDQACYDTAWCEPKLFVIDVLNEKGQLEAHSQPIYGCRFDEQDFLDLLKRYLACLDIKNAKSIQIIADGAPWIWLNVKEILVKLGVEEDKIVETLDHCHAVGYVHDLVKAIPKETIELINDKIEQNTLKGTAQQKQNDKLAEDTCTRACTRACTDYLKQFKEWLWAGKSDKIVTACRAIFKEPSQEINRWINYLDKHQHRTQYVDFKELKLLCGSGIVESAIRRIVNLKFKNASTFWDKETVEKLFFFRATLLSNRWEILIQNLAKSRFG